MSPAAAMRMNQGRDGGFIVAPGLRWLVALSGAAALAYQLTWVRRLTLLFGSGTLASSAVLAAFMGGLAVGAVAVGHIVTRWPSRALRIYAVLELGIGLWALLVPTLVALAQAAQVAAFPALQNELARAALSCVIALLVVGPGTVLMGGTLPAVARAAADPAAQTARLVASLYSVNVLGALLGIVAATYALLPRLGIARTEFMAISANVLIALWAFLLARRAPGAPDPGEPLNRVDPVPQSRSTLHAVLVLACLSGLAALILEVGMVRVLSMTLGSSTHSVAIMLLVVLGGIALGAAIVRRVPSASPALVSRRLVVLFVLNAVAALAALLVAPQLPVMVAHVFPIIQHSFAAQQLSAVGLTFLAIGPSSLIFGATFPTCVAAVAPTTAMIGRALGLVTASNTVGAILGALVAGFVLIPHLGLRACFLAAALTLIGAALVATWSLAGSLPRRAALTGMLGVTALAAVMTPPWSQRLLASGAAFYASRFPSAHEYLENARSLDLVFYRDGVNTTISVDQIDADRFYRSNGKTDASTMPDDLVVQNLLGELPLLLRPAAQDIFILGLGTGITTAAVARHPVARIDVVDIEASSLEAAGHFEDWNEGVLSDPRLRFIVGDGRIVLAASDHPYDVIVSDPSDIWVAGVANLFTREFYSIVRSRLRPDGVFVQWCHTYGLDREDMRLLIATFLEAFPSAQYWRPSAGDLILVGSPAPLRWDLREVARSFHETPRSTAAFEALGTTTPLALFASFVADEQDLRAVVGSSRQTLSDDLPRIEFAAPQRLFQPSTIDDEFISSMQATMLPPLVGFDLATDLDAAACASLGSAYVERHRLGLAAELLGSCRDRHPGSAEVSRALADVRRALSTPR